MKKYLYFIALSFLTTGCQKIVGLGINQTRVNPVILIAGQSNALRFAQYGTGPLYQKFGSIDVVNCAVGSTTLDQWKVGGHYYQSCIETLRQKRPSIIFWWQGENDTYAGDQSQFAYKTTRILKAFQSLNPNSMVFYAQLGANNSGIVYPNWTVVQQQQENIVLTHGKMIYTADLATELDGIHMTPASEIQVGKRIVAEL